MSDAIQRTRMNAFERDALFCLTIANELLFKAKGPLANRVKAIPHGAMELGRLMAGIDKLTNTVLETVPAEQIISLKRNLKSTYYTLGVRRPGERLHDKEYGCWVSYSGLKTITDALHDHCLVCDLDGTEQRKCPLRKVFDNELPNDLPEKQDGACPYMGVI